MALPNDAFMLLSVVNTKLRDNYDSLDALCDDLGEDKERIVSTLASIGFEYIEGELILLHLSDLGICASSGSACTSGSLEPSHVLRAMGTPFTSLHGSIRFSLSRYTTEDEVDYVLKHLPDVIEKITASSPYQDELEHLRKSK